MTALGFRHVLYGCMALAAVVILPPTLWPQNVFNSSNDASAVHLQLRLTVGATKFHLGEVIPLELAYTSDAPERYQITTTLQHFPFSEPPVRFLLTPSLDTHDPEKAYWDSMMTDVLGGDISTGLGSLSRTPAFVPAVLNDFVVIDRPGLYHLYAISHQVGDLGAASQPVPLTIKSNVIHFEVVADDPAWVRAQLQHIRDVLDDTPPSDPFFPGTPRAHAVKALRFLTSEDAAREMARRLCGGGAVDDFEFMLGLVDSRHRAAARDEMQKLFVGPDFPVCVTFVDTFARLALNKEAAPEEAQSWMADGREDLQGRLLDALSGKRGKALGASVDALLNSRVSTTERPALFKELLRQLPSSIGERVVGGKCRLRANLLWPLNKERKYRPLGLREIAS